MPKAVDTPLAADFAADRVQIAFSLDAGAFQAEPPPEDAAPRISAAMAFCNLLAGATAEGSSVFGAARAHGLSFGLGLVTVTDSLLDGRTRTYDLGGEPWTGSLPSYHRRLAWLAVIKPDLLPACPSAAPRASHGAPPLKKLPSYQILAIDAASGAAGIDYSAKTNDACGYPVYVPESVAPAVEFVSVPWTLVSRGPGPQAAAITYQPRPCDIRDLPRFVATGQQATLADRDNPARVNIVLERVLTTCGPSQTVPLLLRSSTLATDLPPHLIHAPIGAEDVNQ